MIKIENLTIKYDDIIAVDRISLELPPAKIYGFIGPNGAGKSTLLKACAGLIDTYDGAILFEEKDIRKNRYWQKQNCAYAPEDVELLPYLKGMEFLQLIASIRTGQNSEDEIIKLIDMLGLTAKANELIIDFSHGMRQKLSVAATLISTPKYMIFDETLSGLDTIAINKLKAYIRQLAQMGKTILFSSHILSLIRDWSDQVIVLDDGKVSGILKNDEIKNWPATDFPNR